MRAIEIVMLAVQAAALLAAAWAIVMRRPTPERRRPVWSSLAFSLLIIAMVSWQIADKHSGDRGSAVLMYTAPVVLGFALAMLLMALRERRGLDRLEGST